MTSGVSPVVLEADPTDRLSRWLWLVKWLLLLPHILALTVLWLIWGVLTFVAWVMILITGSYPRSIFDLNLGVLRWTWRVQYYGYSALGTDRYPPFTLEEVPSYPARLDIAYPAQLSRGLALVKWLLIIPHAIIVSILVGGARTAYDGIGGNAEATSNSPGLIGVLAFVAGVILLFSGKYPAGLWTFLVGLNRWVFRVIAYIGLMTDTYPPFRLDVGGREPLPTRPAATPTEGDASSAS